jgi:hypothetical protein
LNEKREASYPRKTREEPANFVHQSDISRGSGARRFTNGRLIDLVDRGENIEAFDFFPRAGGSLRAPALPTGKGLRGGLDDVVQQRTLARAANPAERDESSDRKRRVDFLEIIRVRPKNAAPTGRIFRGTALATSRMLQWLAQNFSSRRFPVLRQRLPRAGGNDFTALRARAGAEIDDAIGEAHRVLIVLDDDERIAAVAQCAERIEQPLVVARMQADGRLVEHVEDALQLRAKLRREPDALRFATGQRRRRAIQREITEPDLHEKFEPLDDLRQNIAGDARFAAFRFHSAEKA